MMRTVFSALGFLAICGIGWAQDPKSGDAPRLTLGFQQFEIDQAFLDKLLGEKELEKDKGFFPLTDVQVFRLLESRRANEGRVNVYGLGKTLYESGESVKFYFSDPAARLKAEARAGAWRCGRPCRFAFTPTISEKRDSVTLEFHFEPQDRRRQEITIKVAQEACVLLLLDDVAEGIHRGFVVAPSIVPDRGSQP